MADKYMYPGRALEPGGFGKYPISELVSFEDKPRAKPTVAPVKRQAVGASGTWDEAPTQPQAAPASMDAAIRTSINDGNAQADTYNAATREQKIKNQLQDYELRSTNSDALAKFHASGDVGNYSVAPASGSYNPDNVRIQRDQDAYWGNRKQVQDAQYALDNFKYLSKADKAMYTAQLAGGQKGLEGMRGDDTTRRGQDTTRYGYDQQRATGQDSNLASQMRQDTDPTKSAGAIASLQQGEYYGAQAEQAGLANESAKRIQSLHQQFTAEQDPAKKASLLENIRSLSPNPEKRYMHVAGGMDMNGNKLPDVIFDTVSGKPVGGAQGRTTAQIKAKLAERKIPESEWAAYLAEASDAPAEKHAQGGAVGYAQGGEIASPLADPMQQVHPMVGEYRRYSMMAQQLGATPVSFEQFGALRQSAATQGHQVAPMQENFAGGGAVPEGGGIAGWLREKLMPETTARIRGDRTAQEIDRQTGGGVHRSGYEKPRPEVHSTDPETEALLRKYKNFAEGGPVWDEGYADGGAIPVGGRQVLGPGDGKSDSIPAVIDGKRPAALSTGEFVFPVEAVRHFGMDRLNKMVEAARKPQGA